MMKPPVVPQALQLVRDPLLMTAPRVSIRSISPSAAVALWLPIFLINQQVGCERAHRNEQPASPAGVGGHLGKFSLNELICEREKKERHTVKED